MSTSPEDVRQDAVSSDLREKVVQFLLKNPGRWFSPEEIAKGIGEPNVPGVHPGESKVVDETLILLSKTFRMNLGLLAVNGAIAAKTVRGSGWRKELRYSAKV